MRHPISMLDRQRNSLYPQDACSSQITSLTPVMSGAADNPLKPILPAHGLVWLHCPSPWEPMNSQSPLHLPKKKSNGDRCTLGAVCKCLKAFHSGMGCWWLCMMPVLCFVLAELEVMGTFWAQSSMVQYNKQCRMQWQAILADPPRESANMKFHWPISLCCCVALIFCESVMWP